jgi:hypothetical protein
MHISCNLSLSLEVILQSLEGGGKIACQLFACVCFREILKFEGSFGLEPELSLPKIWHAREPSAPFGWRPNNWLARLVYTTTVLFLTNSWANRGRPNPAPIFWSANFGRAV